MADGAIYAEDIANRYGMPLPRAKRWLLWLDRKYGSAVVGHLPSQGGGVIRFTTAAALGSIAPSTVARLGLLERRVEDVEADVKSVIGRIDRLEQQRTR